MFLYPSSVSVLVSITFWSILPNFLSLKQIKKSKMVGPIWLPFGKQDLILMPCDSENCCCKPQRKHFWMYYLPSIFPEVFIEKWGIQLLPSSGRPERNPSLDGVQCGLLLSSTTHLYCIVAYNQNSHPVHTVWKMKSSFNFVFTQITAMKDQLKFS